jgi:gluconate 2-dehydrogenase gamma chain
MFYVFLKVIKTKEEDFEEKKAMDRRRFIKLGAAAAVAAGIAATVPLPFAQTDANQDNGSATQLNQLQSQNSALQSQLDSSQGIITLSINEQLELDAIVETIIPTDSNGPGAKEAGVIYFIDRQLTGEYGNNARWYMKGPFVLSGQPGPITVDGITYPQGTPTVPFTGPTFQYNLPMREFWRIGLSSLQTYSNSVYGRNVQDLTAEEITQLLTDLYNNVPTNFGNIVPRDFFNELIFMTWSGFLMDPLYGGNIGMVGWLHTGFTGANMADSFNEGRNVLELMVADKPTRFPPHSLGEFQRTLNLIGGS